MYITASAAKLANAYNFIRWVFFKIKINISGREVSILKKSL